jgi:hypothetical protein
MRLTDKKFRVIVNGETERRTNWNGVKTLLKNFGDYDYYNAVEKKRIRNEWRNGNIYIDANITCVMIKKVLAVGN